MPWWELLYALVALGVGWWTYKMILHNPEAFSRKTLKKLQHYGCFGIVLIVVIAICVLLLREG